MDANAHLRMRASIDEIELLLETFGFVLVVLLRQLHQLLLESARRCADRWFLGSVSVPSIVCCPIQVNSELASELADLCTDPSKSSSEKAAGDELTDDAFHRMPSFDTLEFLSLASTRRLIFTTASSYSIPDDIRRAMSVWRNVASHRTR